MTRGRIEAILWALVIGAMYAWIIYDIGWLRAIVLFVALAVTYVFVFAVLPVGIRWLSGKLARK